MCSHGTLQLYVVLVRTRYLNSKFCHMHLAPSKAFRFIPRASLPLILVVQFKQQQKRVRLYV